MAAVARDHARHDQPAQVQHGAQVDVDQQVDVLGVGLQERLGRSTPALLTRMSNVDLAA